MRSACGPLFFVGRVKSRVPEKRTQRCSKRICRPGTWFSEKYPPLSVESHGSSTSYGASSKFLLLWYRSDRARQERVCPRSNTTLVQTKSQPKTTLPTNPNRPRWELPWRRHSSISTRTVVALSPHRAFQQASGRWVYFRSFRRRRWTRCVLSVCSCFGHGQVPLRIICRDVSALPPRLITPLEVGRFSLTKQIYQHQVISSFGGDGDGAVSLPKFLCFLGKEYGRGASGRRGKAAGGVVGGRSLAGRLRLILKKVKCTFCL